MRKPSAGSPRLRGCGEGHERVGRSSAAQRAVALWPRARLIWARFVPYRPNDPADREDESDEEHDLVAVLPGQHPGGEQTDKPEEAEQSSHKYHWLMAKSTKISFVAVVPEPSHPLRMECRWSRPSGFTDG